MVRLKNNYFLVILILVSSTLFVQCKNQSEKTKSDKEGLAVSTDTQKPNQSKSKFTYNDLVNKTFLPVHLKEDGSYQYLGDISKEFDMGENRIRFRRNKIMHLMPIEWYEFYIYKKKYDSDWLQLNLIGHYDYHHKDTTNQFLHYFKYDKEKNLLFFSDRRTNDHLEIFMDSTFIALKEREKPVLKKEDIHKKHIVFKPNKIILEGKEVEISVPYVKEHLNEYGNKIFGESQILENLEVKLLRGSKRDLYYAFAVDKCATCANFSAIYDMDGNNLTYSYTTRDGQKLITLISKGDEDKIFADYGFSDRDINIQINHADTPTYVIKDWY